MFAKLLRKFTSETLQQTSSFTPYPFPSFVQTVLKKKNFSEPTEIQKQAWPLLLERKDLVGVAKTGSGKTLAYLLPMISSIIKSHNNNLRVIRHHKPRALIVLPTRELAKQVASELSHYAYPGGIRFTTIYGGEQKSGQKQLLTSGTHAVIGTPGRIIDFMADNVLSLEKIDYLVLDEADMMLDMGFEQSIRNIVLSANSERQTVMFSATWPKEIESIAGEFLTNPEKIQVGNSELTMNEDIQHNFVFSPRVTVNDSLKQLVAEHTGAKFLIFVNTKIGAEKLRMELVQDGVSVETLHSDKNQMQRNYAMLNFKSGESKILIATDVASRGIDIKGIDFVVNYELPQNIDDYIHRVGRTGRAGKKGAAVTYFNETSKKGVMKAIIKKLKEVGQEPSEKFRDVAFTED